MEILECQSQVKYTQLLMYGTVYLILFVLLVLLFLRNVLELLILVSF